MLAPVRRLAWTLPVAALALWLVFREARAEAVIAALRRLHAGWLGGALLFMVVTVGVRLLRWGLLVRAVSQVPVAAVGRIGAIGYMAIDLLPLRSGELVRPLLLRRRGVELGAGLATCVVERLADVVVLLGILVAAMALADLPPLVLTVFDRPVDLAAHGRDALLLASLALGAPTVGLVLAGEPGLRALGWLARPLPSALAQPLLGSASSLQGALKRSGRPGLLAGVGALSLATWAATLAVQALLLRAFGVELGLGENAVVMLVIALALLLPAPAGALGVFEAGCAAGLALYGVEPSVAAAAAVTLHATHVGVFTVVGLASLGAEGVGLGELSRGLRAAQRG